MRKKELKQIQAELHQLKIVLASPFWTDQVNARIDNIIARLEPKPINTNVDRSNANKARSRKVIRLVDNVEYESVTQAARLTGVCKLTIIRHCRDYTPPTQLFKYAD